MSSTTLATVSALSAAAVATAACLLWNRSTPAAAKPWVIRSANLQHVVGLSQGFVCQFHGTDESRCRRYEKIYDYATDGDWRVMMAEARHRPMLCTEHSRILEARGHITTLGYLTALGAEHCEVL